MPQRFIFCVALPYPGRVDGRGAEGEGGPAMHCELHVHDVDDLVRNQHKVLADVDVLQGKRGVKGGACGRVQQDI